MSRPAGVHAAYLGESGEESVKALDQADGITVGMITFYNGQPAQFWVPLLGHQNTCALAAEI
jgi:hypothetical protein